MIKLTKIDGRILAINEDAIETISESPDTIIILKSGRSCIVKESIEEILALTVQFRQNCRKTSKPQKL